MNIAIIVHVISLMTNILRKLYTSERKYFDANNRS